MEYTRITPAGEEKCSLLDGDGMTREVMLEVVRSCCTLNFCETCPIYHLDYCDALFSDWSNEALNEAYKIIYKPPVNFVKANPNDAVESESDAVESGLADSGTRYEKHRTICEKLNDTYRKKNTDYGNSFGIGFAEYGLIMPVIRLEDKFQRLKRLALGGEQNVADENIKDTLLDLANYAIMTLVEMEAGK